MPNQKYSADEIRANVKKLIAEITEREEGEISDSADFAKDLGLDSLMAMELMTLMDKTYKINIPEEEFIKIQSVNDAVASVQRFVS